MKTQPLTVHLLPTEDASDLIMGQDKKLWIIENNKNKLPELLVPYHLYLCSTEPIKEGDWYIDDTNAVRKSITSNKDYWSVRTNYKKILFTTDHKLIADGVLPIDGNTRALRFGDIQLPSMTAPPAYRSVNLLTEFCKRYNQNDNHQEVRYGNEKTAPYHNFSSDNPNDKGVDVEKLAESIYGKTARDYVEVLAFIRGYNQALQSTWSFILDENSRLRILLLDCLDTFEVVIDGRNEIAQKELKMKIENELLKIQPEADIIIECEMENINSGWQSLANNGKRGSTFVPNNYRIKLDGNGQPILKFK